MISYVDSLDQVACSLSIKISVTETPTRETTVNSQVYQSKGLINVRYSFLSGGAPEMK